MDEFGVFPSRVGRGSVPSRVSGGLRVAMATGSVVLFLK